MTINLKIQVMVKALPFPSVVTSFILLILLAATSGVTTDISEH